MTEAATDSVAADIRRYQGSADRWKKSCVVSPNDRRFADLPPADLSDADLKLLPKRPRTRGDCANVPRPCPYVSCAHHLYLDVTKGGAIQLNFPDREPWELEHSCALDIAEQDGCTLEDAGRLINVTRERIRQMEEKVFLTLRARSEKMSRPLERRVREEYADGEFLTPAGSQTARSLLREYSRAEADPDESQAPEETTGRGNPIPPPVMQARIDSLGIVCRDSDSPKEAPDDRDDPADHDGCDPAGHVGRRLKETPMPKDKHRCTYPGCERQVNPPKSGTALPGSDLTKCCHHRAELLGLTVDRYYVALKEFREGKPFPPTPPVAPAPPAVPREPAESLVLPPMPAVPSFTQQAAKIEEPQSAPPVTITGPVGGFDFVRFRSELADLSAGLYFASKELERGREALAICEAIGWETARALAAKIGTGGAK